MFGYLVQYTKDLFDYDAPIPVSTELVSWILKREKQDTAEIMFNVLMDLQKNQFSFVTSQGETIEFKNDFKTDFSKQSLKILQMGAGLLQYQNHKDESKLQLILNELHKMGYDEEKGEQILTQQEIATTHGIYKSLRQKPNQAIEQLRLRENMIQEWMYSIESKLSENCLKHYEVIGDGLDTFEQIKDISVKQTSKIRILRQQINSSRSTLLSVGLRIQKRQHEVLRVKYILEKLSVLKTTFGQLVKKMNEFMHSQETIGAYQIIPLMKAAQENIQKFNLKDLNLACIMNCDNFFDAKIEQIKQTVSEGIDNCLIEFNSTKYFSFLQSYFYLQVQKKHFNIFKEILWHGGLLKQIMAYIKRAIKSTMFKGFQSFEKQSGTKFQVINTDKIYTVVRISQISKDYIPRFFKFFYKEVADLLINFYYCNRFHQNYLLHLEEQSESEGNCTIDKEYIDQEQFTEFLETLRLQYLSLRTQIWTQIQKKLAKIIQSFDLMNQMPANLFYQIIGLNCLLIKRAEDFSQSSSKLICEALISRILDYNISYHKQNIKFFQTYFGNEEFRRLPVGNQGKSLLWFSDLKIKSQNINRQIFQYLNFERKEQNELSPDIKRHINQDTLFETELETQIFYIFGHQNPFSLQDEEFRLLMSSLWFQVDQNQLQNNKITSEVEMVFTATSLKLFQMYQNYFTVMLYAPFLTPVIFKGFIQLLKSYIYLSFQTLIANKEKLQLEETFSNLHKYDENKEIELYQTQYEYFSECVIIQDRFRGLKRFYQSMAQEIKQQKDQKDTDVFARERPPFQDIAERAMAIDSIYFLIHWMKKGCELVLDEESYPEESQLVMNELNFLQELTSQSVSQVLYKSYMQQHIKIDGILTNVIHGKWDLRENIVNPQNPYVDRLIKFICDQRDKLKSLGGGSISSYGQREIFENFIEYCLNLLLEAYGQVKKINIPGRELMYQEFKHIYKSVSQAHPDIKMPIKLESIGSKFLQMFSCSIDSIWDFVVENRKNIPFRQTFGLYYNCPAYQNMKRANKKDELNRFFKMYSELFEFQLC